MSLVLDTIGSLLGKMKLRTRDTDGVVVKEDPSGSLSVLNSTESAFAALRSAGISLTGANQNDSATLFDVNGAFPSIEFSFDGAAPTDATTVSGLWGICHTAGGIYSEGDVVKSDGTLLTEIPVALCKALSAKVAVTGDLSLTLGGMYTRNAAGTWGAVGGASSSTTGVLIPDLSTDLSYSGLVEEKMVLSNALGFGALLRDGVSGLALDDGSDTSTTPGLFMALEAGAGVRTVMPYGLGLVRNDAWSWTPLTPLYRHASTLGAMSHTVNGAPIGYAQTSTTISLGDVHGSYSSASATIALTITGTDFEAVITAPTADSILWTFPDTSTDATEHPVVTGVGAGTVTLVVTPGSALTHASFGYDGADGGATFTGGFGAADGPYALAQQNVTAITGLTSANGLTHVSVSGNPITALDVSSLSSLQIIEGFGCTVLATLNTAGCFALRRSCVEYAACESLDYSSSHLVEDLRGAAQTELTSLTLASTLDALDHCCFHHTNIGAGSGIPDPSIMPVLTEYFMDNVGATGNVVFNSDVLSYVRLNDNTISTISVTSGGVLNFGNNGMSADAVDDILETVNGFGNSGGTLILTGNAAPTSTGLTHVVALEGRSWTVNVEASTAPYVTVYSPADNEEDVELDATCTLTFSEIVNAVSGNITMVETGVGNAEVFDVTSEISGSGTSSISFSPTAWDRNKDYHFLIDSGAFENSVEVAYTGITDPTVWNIKTRPMYDTLSPADDASSVAVDSAFEIVFPEAMTAQAGGEIRIHLSSDDSTVEAFNVTSDITGDGTITIGFTPTANLDPSEEYYVQIDQGSFQNLGLEDFEGILNSTDWNVSTAAASSSLWEDLLDRAEGPVGNEWESATCTGTINANEQLTFSGGSGYQQFSNPCTAANLPANCIVTVAVPHSQLALSYWGLSGHYNASTTNRGIRLFMQGPTICRLGYASTSSAGNVTIDTTGGGWSGDLAASWAEEKEHTLALRMIGTTCTIYMDGYYYGVGTIDVNNSAGMGVALVGEWGSPGDLINSITVEAAT